MCIETGGLIIESFVTFCIKASFLRICFLQFCIKGILGKGKDLLSELTYLFSFSQALLVESDILGSST